MFSSLECISPGCQKKKNDFLSSFEYIGWEPYRIWRRKIEGATQDKIVCIFFIRQKAAQRKAFFNISNPGTCFRSSGDGSLEGVHAPHRRPPSLPRYSSSFTRKWLIPWGFEFCFGESFKNIEFLAAVRTRHSHLRSVCLPSECDRWYFMFYEKWRSQKKRLYANRVEQFGRVIHIGYVCAAVRGIAIDFAELRFWGVTYKQKEKWKKWSENFEWKWIIT